MNFNDENLVAKYGSWVRVQVEFYDFLFEIGSQTCAHRFNDLLATHRFADGQALYDESVAGIEKTFASPESAWEEFVAYEKTGVMKPLTIKSS